MRSYQFYKKSLKNLIIILFPFTKASLVFSSISIFLITLHGCGGGGGFGTPAESPCYEGSGIKVCASGNVNEAGPNAGMEVDAWETCLMVNGVSVCDGLDGHSIGMQVVVNDTYGSFPQPQGITISHYTVDFSPMIAGAPILPRQMIPVNLLLSLNEGSEASYFTRINLAGLDLKQAFRDAYSGYDGSNAWPGMPAQWPVPYRAVVTIYGQDWFYQDAFSTGFAADILIGDFCYVC